MAGVDVVVVTLRDIFQNVAQETGRFGEDYGKMSALILLDGGDLAALGVEDGSPVAVESDFGSVVVVARKDEEAHRGIAFMPNSPWSNQLVSPEAAGGIPDYKRIKASVTPSGEGPTSLDEIVERMRA